jgi:hypothetical protein
MYADIPQEDCTCPPARSYMVDGFNTCMLCGVINDQMEYLNGVENYIEPLQICVYQRKKRFEEMLKKLIYPHAERKDEIVLEALFHLKFENTQALITFLKQTDIKDKRYQSVHAFARLCCTDYKPVKSLSHPQLKRCVQMFEEVEYRFLKHTRNVPFFNYNWLMKNILHLIGVTRFDPYLKNIKCKKRNAYYENLFTTLCKEPLVQGGVPNCP